VKYSPLLIFYGTKMKVLFSGPISILYQPQFMLSLIFQLAKDMPKIVKGQRKREKQMASYIRIFNVSSHIGQGL
jgi:hypothetical protein